MINKIDVVYIHTKNIDRLKKWYNEILGLNPGYGDSHWQEFNVKGGSRFALDSVNDESSDPQKQKIIISFYVDDIYKEVERLSALGVEFYPSPRIQYSKRVPRL